MKKVLFFVGISLCLANSQEDSVLLNTVEQPDQQYGLDTANLRRQDAPEYSQDDQVQTWRQSDDLQVEQFQPDVSGQTQGANNADLVQDQYQPDLGEFSQGQVAEDASQGVEYGQSTEYGQDDWAGEQNQDEPQEVVERSFELPEAVADQALESNSVLTLLSPQENEWRSSD